MSEAARLLRGVVHGRTIELVDESGLPDGQEIDVVVQPTASESNRSPGPGIRSPEGRPTDPEENPPVSQLWGQVRDESAGVPSRLEAMDMLLIGDRQAAIQYLAEELSREAVDEEWRVALVFLAEDVHFPADLQPGVKDALLRIAHSFRTSAKAGADRVVWSAIRRASSLFSPADANLLVPFLDRPGVVDARAVALKCVERLFHPAPPSDPELVRPIGDRAYTLATKFLDSDIFSGGEFALLAQSAVCALAAIGDARVEEAVTLADRLDRRWLRHQLRTKLKAIHAAWQSKGAEVAASSAFRNLESVLTRLT